MGMYDPHPQPAIAIQEVAAGRSFSDSLPVGGVDSGNTLLRGRYRRWVGCQDAGRFQVNPEYGNRISTIVYSVPGTTVTFQIVDGDGFVYPLFTSPGPSGVYVELSDFLIPPGCHLACVTAGAVAAPGRVYVEFIQGLDPSVFDIAPMLGSEVRPPGPF